MNLIVPYEEKELYNCEGAFIKPDGEIIYIIYGCHESFSMEYCNGLEYSYLLRLRSGDTHDSNAFEDYKKEHNFQGNKEDIDVFSSTKLTKEQLELYKLWKDKYEFSRKNLISDFMVYILQFDKLETMRRTTITTTNPNRHIRFFNYYLMDWNIDYESPMKYNRTTEQFEFDNEKNYLSSSEDREAEEKIRKIKSTVKKRQRHLFFK